MYLGLELLTLRARGGDLPKRIRAVGQREEWFWDEEEEDYQNEEYRGSDPAQGFMFKPSEEYGGCENEYSPWSRTFLETKFEVL